MNTASKFNKLSVKLPHNISTEMEASVLDSLRRTPNIIGVEEKVVGERWGKTLHVSLAEGADYKKEMEAINQIPGPIFVAPLYERKRHIS